MPIVAKASADFTPAPAGTHAATCVDVVDLGILEVTYIVAGSGDCGRKRPGYNGRRRSFLTPKNIGSNSWGLLLCLKKTPGGRGAEPPGLVFLLVKSK